jgi:chromosome segregation ATPase
VTLSIPWVSDIDFAGNWKKLTDQIARIDTVLYFNAKETAQYKQSLTGINHTIDGLKIAVALGATVSAQLLKIDLSFVKIDEKGISVRGKDKLKWSDVTGMKAKDAADKAQRERERIDREIGEARGVATHADREVEKLKDRLRVIGSETEAARNSRTGLRSNHRGAQATDPRVGPVAKDVVKLQEAVDALASSLGRI